MIVAYYKDRFVDPDERHVPLQERAYNFGDGVYEVVRFYHGQPFGLNEHVQRLEESAAAIRMALPYTQEEIKRIVSEAVEKTGEDIVDVYFQVSRGEATRLHPFPKVDSCLALIAKPGRLFPDEQRQSGIAAVTLEDQRWANCHIKCLNLLANVMAKQEALDMGAGEAILVRDGFVTEGSSSNIFLVRGGELHTPVADRRILNGITRRMVIAVAKRLGVRVVERDIPEADLLTGTDEAFVTSTTMEMMPLRSINGAELPSGGMGEVSALLLTALRGTMPAVPAN